MSFGNFVPRAFPIEIGRGEGGAGMGKALGTRLCRLEYSCLSVELSKCKTSMLPDVPCMLQQHTRG